MLAIVVVTVEGLAWIAIAMVPHRNIRRKRDIFADQSAQLRDLLDPSKPKLLETHPVLGWRNAANFTNSIHQLNSQGLRATLEYSSLPGPNVIRIAAFGSSIVYCSEVDNSNAWPALIEAANPDMEVLNYGVGGYGTDQAYLRYCLEGSEFSPHVVVIGFTSDELGRTVNVYRRFISTRDSVCIKPRYQLNSQNELSLLGVPVTTREDYERLLAHPQEVTRLGEHDRWYQASMYENPVYDYSAAMRLTCWMTSQIQRRYLDPDWHIRARAFNNNSTAFHIQMALFDEFSKVIRASGAVPLVVLLPEKESVQQHFQGGAKLYDPLRSALRDRGIDYVDAIDGFQKAGTTTEIANWYASGGHYSESGCKVIASWLPDEIRKRVPGKDTPRDANS